MTASVLDVRLSQQAEAEVCRNNDVIAALSMAEMLRR